MRGQMFFHDRIEAGKLLANELLFLRGKGNVIVLAIPRGGVPLGKEVADAIGAPLDIVITRKIGAPGNPELAIGAVTEEGETIIESNIARMVGATADYVKEEAKRQVKEIKIREEKYRGTRPYPKLEGKTVVIVDDGIATGSTIRAAIQSVKRQNADKIILAAPVGPPDIVRELSKDVDKVVCLSTPDYFQAIGEFYEEFGQVGDDTVEEILRERRVSESPKPSSATTRRPS